MSRDDVLRMIYVAGGDFTWDKNATVPGARPGWRKRNPPPEHLLKKLTEEGYVEVETRTVSVWKYGPRDDYTMGYASDAWKKSVKVKIAILDSYDKPTLKSRVEVRAILTPRGRDLCESLGLVD